MTKVKCIATTCKHNETNYCNLPEVDLAFAGAWDFGGGIGTRVFLRCTDIMLPSDLKRIEEEQEQ